MRIAIPVWHCRVSPLLDSACVMRIYQLDRNNLELAEELTIDQLQTQELPAACADHLVDMIICGALSRNLQCDLENYGIGIYPWVSGIADDVICAYYADKQLGERFHMPGKPASAYPGSAQNQRL